MKKNPLLYHCMLEFFPEHIIITTIDINLPPLSNNRIGIGGASIVSTDSLDF